MDVEGSDGIERNLENKADVKFYGFYNIMYSFLKKVGKLKKFMSL